MILDKVLILKGLGGLITCAGLSCGAALIVNPDLFKTNEQILNDLISKVGLTTCTTTSPECSIENSGLNLKQDDDKVENKAKQNGSSGTEGKIKVYANNTDYHKGFKFVIEDGDISLADSKKLEQFETYEIKEDGDKWYLTRKNKDIEEKKKFLGLPSSCTLVTNENTDSCTLTEEQVKAINFKDKGTGKNISVASGVTTKLTIIKSSDTAFPEGGYKFIFKTTGDVTIPKSEDNQQITIKANTNTEFKINKSNSNEWTLEKAWTVTKLAEKIGLTCPAESTTKECSLPTSNTLNLYNSESDKTTSVTIKTDSQTKKLKYEEDKEGYNQGFKFYAEQEISLDGDDGKKIETSPTATYEIKKVKNEWYLAKKSNGN